MSQPRGDVQVLVSTHTRAEKPWVLWRGALVFTHLVFWICLGLFGAVEVSPQVAEDFCAQHDRIALLRFVLELQPVLRLSECETEGVFSLLVGDSSEDRCSELHTMGRSKPMLRDGQRVGWLA